MDKLGKIKHVGPTLLYVSQALKIILFILIVADIVPKIVAVALELVIWLIELVSLGFFWIGARKIKQAYPTMKAEAKASRAAYLALKHQK